MSKERPEYVSEMLSESFTRKSGIFNFESISFLLNKIDKTGTASEVENMILTTVISTHLLHHQFIEYQNEEFSSPQLQNMKIIEDLK